MAVITNQALITAPSRTNALVEQVAEFLEFKRRSRKVGSPATHEQYHFILENVWLVWCARAGITDVAQATDKVMDRFVDYLQMGKDRKRPLSIATIRTYLRATRTFLNWAKVPRGDFQAPPQLKRLRNPPSRLEIDAMEHATNDERDRLVVRVLADSGVRVSELLGLRPQDLRAEGRQYFIRVIGKRNKEREVGIPAEVFKRLKQFAGDREYIFYSKRPQKGRTDRLTKSGAEQLIRHLAKSAGIERRMFPHLLRHAYCTHMARKKVPMLDVARSMGHESLAMVTEVYSHITAEDSYDTLMAALKG
jgi:integrase/recombinase XerD